MLNPDEMTAVRRIQRALPEKVSVMACDLDGTLLNRAGQLSSRVTAATHALRDAEVHVVIATGRSARDVRRLNQELGGSRYAVCLNGAVVLDLQNESIEEDGILSPDVVRAWTLESDLLREIAETVRRAYPQITFGTEQASLRVAREKGRVLFGWRWDPEFEEQDLEELLAAPVMKLFLSDLQVPGPVLQERVEALNLPGVTITRSTELGMLELAAAGVSKGSALQVVCARLGTTPEEMVAVGDMPNDVQMLLLAGCGVAMGNADEAALLAADTYTLSNSEEGAALLLETVLERVSVPTGQLNLAGRGDATTRPAVTPEDRMG